MKFLKASIVLSAIILISDPAVIAQVNADAQSVHEAERFMGIGFQADELPPRLAAKSKLIETADRVVADCAAKKFEEAMDDANSFARLAKAKREDIALMLSAADACQSTDKDKAVALRLMAYQNLKVAGRATADETISHLFRIASTVTTVNSNKGTEPERQFATGLIEQALQIRRMSGGIKQSDAPFVLLRARLEFTLKHWDNAIKEYEFWLGMYGSKGQDPPANDLSDALGELGISYTSLKDIPKAEQYFRRACAAATAFNETTVTPINQYDVEDFLIFNLLNQNSLDQAKELAQKHLEFKEKTLGLRSPQLADELNRYADLFEQAGETSFSFSLRARAGRVVSP